MTGIRKRETKTPCEKDTTYQTAPITPTKKGTLLIYMGPGKLLGDRLKDAWVKIAENVWRRK
jgi:hypothetical protein